jgi:hypothetical protein
MKSSRYLLALDQGTSSSRSILFDREGNPFPAARLGRARSASRSGRTSWTVAQAALRQAGLAPGHRRHRHRQPARNRCAVGRSSGRPLHNAIVWQDRRTAEACARLKAGAPRRWCERKPAWCSTPTSRPPSWPGCSTTCPARAIAGATRRTGFRHHRQLARLEPLRRPAARHRPQQRLAHLAVRHSRRRLGRRTAGAVRHPARVLPRVIAPAHCAARPRRTCSAARSPSAAWPATSRPPCSARPATAPAWRRTPMAPAASC